MFDKVEFSDLYKFKTSIGLLIIGLGIILPWLFLKQEGELLVSKTDYINLIPESKLLLDKKLSLTVKIIELIPTISVTLVSIGTLLTGIGYYKWRAKQKIADATERINYDNLKAGIKQQSSTEILDKANKDVAEEMNYKTDQELSTDSEPENHSEEKTAENIIEHIRTNSSLTESLISMENKFLEKITTYNSFNFKLGSKVKIANSYEVDFLLNAYNSKAFKDIIIEVKYLQSKLTMQLVRDSFKRGLHVSALYYNATKRNSQFVLIIVYRENIANEEETTRFLKAVNDYIVEINSNTHKIFVMSDKQVDDFKIEGIVK